MGRASLIPRRLICLALCCAGCSREPRIRVGSKNFSEQLVLGEIVAQHLENRLHGQVSRRLDLGGTLLAQQSIVSGEIDVYPEYTGTALTAVLKQQPDKDPAQVLERVRQAYRQWQLEWLDPLGFENTFAMAVRKEDADGGALSGASSARAWRLGAGYEFAHRPDGLPGLLERQALLELSGRIDSVTMRRLNYELDGKHRPAREIARDFLRASGLQ
ncbi:MAG: glycine betaine ABC transporter substrate-binding protein [Bryobacteraceae bacterium]